MGRRSWTCLAGEWTQNIYNPFILFLPSTIHIYEPVPAFNTQLAKLWAGYRRELGYNATVHMYGLGSSNR